MTKLRVFIFAADEAIGFGIVSNLLSTDGKLKDKVDTVYAGILNESKRDELEELGAKVVKYEKDNTSNTKEFLKKSDIVVLIAHSIDQAFSTATLMMKEVLEAKVPCNILVSQYNADKSSLISPLRGFLLLEGEFKSFNFNGAIIKCGFLIDNLLHISKSIRDEKKLKLSIGDAIVTPISKKEVSLAVCSYLVKYHKEVETLSNYETLVLTGDKEYDGNGIARSISKLIKEDIEYEDVTQEEMDKLLEEQGLSYQHRKYILDLFGIAKGNHFKIITNDYERITGERPKGIQQFIKDNSNNFKPSI